MRAHVLSTQSYADAHTLQEDINDCTSPMSHQPETVQAISLINKRATESACWVDYSSPHSFRPNDSWILKVLSDVGYWYLLFVWHEKILDDCLFCLQSSSQYNSSGVVCVCSRTSYGGIWQIWPWTTKPVISSTSILVAIAKNTLQK